MRKFSYLNVALLAIVILMTAFVGCDNREYLPDSFEIKSLTAPDTLFSGIEAELKAVVVEKDTNIPAPNQSVTFKTTTGIIEARAETNEFGVATVKFTHDLKDDGETTVEASIDQSIATVGISLIPHPGDFVIVKLAAHPEFTYLDNGKTYSNIRALVRDKDGMGVVGETVRFSTKYGRITASAVTDSTGLASVRFTDNLDPPPAGEPATIKAKIDNSERTVNVEIRPAIEDYEIAISASPRVIYADGDITYSTIRATVKDYDGFPVPEAIVRFRTNLGQISGQVLTDERGVAATTFTDGYHEDDDLASYLGTAEIWAVIGDYGASVEVEIQETPEIDEIEFEDVQASIALESQLRITVRAVNVHGDPVSDGTLVTFTASKGSFEEAEGDLPPHMSYSNNGYASVSWNAGTTAGRVIFTARIGSIVAETESYIRAGEAEFIYLRPEFRNRDGDWENLPPAGVPVDFTRDVRIVATVVDLFDNAVTAGQPIRFSTDLGSIQGAAATDDEGKAYARFYPGATSGTAEITATTRNEEVSGIAIVHIYSDVISSISFVQDEEIFLDVRGVGGVESRTLTAELLDLSGNRVTGQHSVLFEIIRGPAGVNINNVGDSDVVLGNNGVARAAINSGSESGTVTVRVSLVENPDIQATKANIVVRSGPPASVEPFIGDFDTGTALTGGMWKVQAGAIVRDSNGNEVIDGTVVYFSLGSTPEAPGNTSISGAGYVGNEGDDSEDGDPGVAYTHVRYHGKNTNYPIVIIAETGEVEGRATVKLPLQQPRFELSASPQHVDFFLPDAEPAYHDVEVIGIVRDGQGNTIVGSKILLLSSHGEIRYHPRAVPFPPDPDTPDYEPEYIYTLDGDAFGERGYAYGILRGFKWEIPPPFDEYFTMVDVQVTARLVGADTIGQTSFTMYLYSIGQPPPPAP